MSETLPPNMPRVSHTPHDFTHGTLDETVKDRVVTVGMVMHVVSGDS